MNDLPSYLSLSPVGIHILDLEGFANSPYKAPTSSDPERLSWTDQSVIQNVAKTSPATAKGRASVSLLIYNKSRDTDRICPCCHRWYHVGESAFGETGSADVFATFEDFVTRPPLASSPDFEHDEVAREQDLSGICSRICKAAMTSGEDSRLNIDQVTPEQIIGRSPLKEESTWDVRKTSPEEEESMAGVKLIFYKK